MCPCDATMMPGQVPSPRGSCQCQAWAAAVPGLGTNYICLGRAPNERQHQKGGQGVWGSHTLHGCPLTLLGTQGLAEGLVGRGCSVTAPPADAPGR